MDEARKIVTRSLAHGTGIAKVGGVWCSVDNAAASCDGTLNHRWSLRLTGPWHWRKATIAKAGAP